MKDTRTAGFTIPEMIITIVVFGFIASTAYLLLMAHINTSTNVQMRASSLSLATEEMEYLRSLPYDSLAVQGGGIVTGATPLPAVKQVNRGQRVLQVVTDIRYADDAFDGCLNYGASQQALCRNYKTGTPLTDTNPRDYKVADIKVKDKISGKQYAALSSQFTSRVAETAGNSSAILVTVLDSSGSPVPGTAVRVRNTSTSPNVDQTLTSDTNGVALFLDVVPDSNPRYVVSASKNGYSSLSTIAASGSLTPTYPNLNAITQQVSNATLKIDEISSSSLEISFVNEAGSPVNGMNFKIKGGIKLYTDAADSQYSYTQTLTVPAGTNVMTIPSLVPGDYRVCYDTAIANACGSTPSRYILALRAAYGSVSHQPFVIPAGTVSTVDGGPMQRVVAVVSTGSSQPRIYTVTPATVSASASDANTTELRLTGANLSGATVVLRQASATIASTIGGSDTSTSIERVFNMSGANQGAYEIVVTNSSGTVIQTGVSPGTIGGINVGQ